MIKYILYPNSVLNKCKYMYSEYVNTFESKRIAELKLNKDYLGVEKEWMIEEWQRTLESVMISGDGSCQWPYISGEYNSLLLGWMSH